MLLEDCAKDCVYFDSVPQSVKETNEEVASQSGENRTKLSQTMTPILAILKKRYRMILMMMVIMDMVDIMNMVNVIEVITIVIEDTKGESSH